MKNLRIKDYSRGISNELLIFQLLFERWTQLTLEDLLKGQNKKNKKSPAKTSLIKILNHLKAAIVFLGWKRIFSKW